MAFGDTLQGALTAGAPAGNQVGASPARVPISFTSRLRQLGASFGTGVTVQEDGSLTSVAIDAASYAAGQGSAFMPSVTMAVNPKTVKFSQPKRWSKKDTRQGSVFFHFTNSKGQNNDILTMTFSGSTGNIDRRGSVSDPNALAIQDSPAGLDTGALQKLLVWHNLYLLTREPLLLSDGSENTVTIKYQSALLVTPILFRGFFNTVLEFEEDGTKPNSRQYSFEFTVTQTFPDLDDVLATLGNTLSTPNSAPVSTPLINIPGNVSNVELA